MRLGYGLRHLALLFLLVLKSLTVQATDAVGTCKSTLSLKPAEIWTAENLANQEITAFAWNLNNLFMRNPELDGEHVGSGHRMAVKADPEIKPEWEVRAIRDMLSRVMPTFGVLTEVENVRAVKRVLEEDERLKGRYVVLTKEGNDERGIDIAMIVQKNHGLRFKFDTHKDLQWTDRYQIGKEWKEEVLPVFSRDLPVVRVYLKDEESPRFIIVGSHAKSQRDREGDPMSRRWRGKQYQEAARIIQDEYSKQYPRAIILFAGDMNLKVMSDLEFKPIREFMSSAFDLAPVDKQIPKEDRYTHSFFPRGGKPSYTMLDDLLFTNGSAVEVLDAQILSFLDKNGQPLPKPKTFAEREKMPSDHQPLLVKFKVRLN